MSGISSLGVGSGLDLGSLVDNLMRIERSAAEAPLNRRQVKAEIRLTAFGILKSAVSGLAGTVDALANLDVGRKVTSSAPTVVAATATAGADAGSYQIEVQRLATAQSLATDALSPFTGPNEAVGEGTLTVSVGGNTANIILAAGANSLDDVRDAINASDVGVHAAIVQNGSEYRLLLTSAVTGTAGQMTLTVDGTVDSRLASAGMDVTITPLDALFRVNGLDITASSNSIQNVLPGLTLELRGVSGVGEFTTLSVGSDTVAVQQKVSAFVTAYNAVIDGFSKVAVARPEAGTVGPLVGDPAVRSLQSRIGTVFSTSFDTDLADNPFSTLVSIGVHTDENGRAVLDADALNNALAESEGGVEALVSAFAADFATKLDAFEGTDGILDFRSEQLSSELKGITQQREGLNLRMEQVEARLRRRFTALDSLVSQFNSTSTFLTQRLATLDALK